MFALRFDGFVQNHIVYKTLAEAKEAYERCVKNTLLYEYDCCVIELDENKNTKRRVSVEELKG